MKTKIHTFAALVIAGLLVLAGCQNPLDPPQTQKSADGEGLFRLQIGGIAVGRTILPAATQTNFAAYTLVFSANGKADITEERTAADLSIAVSLPAATWSLSVTAYMDADRTKPAARGTLTEIVIQSGEPASKSLELKAIIESGQQGTFAWNINYPTDVTSARMTISPLDPATGTAEQSLYFAGGTSQVSKNNSADPLTLKTGYYRVTFTLSNGAHETGRTEYLHVYQNMQSAFAYTFTNANFTVLSVTSGADNGPGTLRHAIANAEADSTIYIESGVGTISLTSFLEIDKNLTIQGNSVTLTRNASWTTVNRDSQLLQISDATVNISRVHFKDGRAIEYGAAIWNGGTLTLESCIFTGNQSNGSTTMNGGGAINNFDSTLTVKGCTFYGNSAEQAGAIYNWYGTLTLTGNLFYGNTASSSPVVGNHNGTVISGGYNVVDVALGTGTTQSGWTSGTNDKTINAMPISPKTFKLLSGSGAANVIAALPAGYPTVDFYGNSISNGAAAGAVQTTTTGGYYLDLSVNDSAKGSVNVSPQPNDDGLVTGSVTITAAPAAGSKFANWLVNGTNSGNANPLILNITAHTKVQAVFNDAVTVNILNDEAGSETTPGTLRYALANAQDGDTIQFSGVTPGVSVIELTSSLVIDKGISIEGNGVTLTRSASWTTVSSQSQLLRIISTREPVNISRVHFKDGRATEYGAAIGNFSSSLTLESCIFSGNQTSATNAIGGAIYSQGSLFTVKGCTFYGNSSGKYGGAINYGGTLTLTGNLFYGNTASNGPVVYIGSGNITSTYNVVDVDFGTGSTESGWYSSTGDQTISVLPISPKTFKVLSGSGASDVINTLPAGYPTADFYGNPISSGAAVGAVQTISGSGYYLDLSVNSSVFGSVSASPQPDEDGVVSGSVTLTATSAAGSGFLNWLVNGTNSGNTNPLILNITAYTKVEAVFSGQSISNITYPPRVRQRHMDIAG